MKKVFMIIAAMCMTSIMASAQKTIRVSTDKTDLVMQVSPKGRLYQVYLGDKLKNPSDYNHLKWDVLRLLMVPSASEVMRFMQPLVLKISSNRQWQ